MWCVCGELFFNSLFLCIYSSKCCFRLACQGPNVKHVLLFFFFLVSLIYVFFSSFQLILGDVCAWIVYMGSGVGQTFLGKQIVLIHVPISNVYKKREPNKKRHTKFYVWMGIMMTPLFCPLLSLFPLLPRSAKVIVFWEYGFHYFLTL